MIESFVRGMLKSQVQHFTYGYCLVSSACECALKLCTLLLWHA
jgi:hypothetical protein